MAAPTVTPAPIVVDAEMASESVTDVPLENLAKYRVVERLDLLFVDEQGDIKEPTNRRRQVVQPRSIGPGFDGPRPTRRPGGSGAVDDAP